MESNIKLDRFQEEAIEYAQKGYSVIVSAPTGAGKTLIAEHIIETCLAKNKGVVYTAPIKALSNQKFRDFSKKYPEKTGILTGDVSINPYAPILIMTTEIFRNAILVNPEELKLYRGGDFLNRDWVIFDEIHYLDDVERGTVWEEAIMLLPNHMRLLALSATIPNIKEFTDWISKIHSYPVKIVIEERRPVPLHFIFQANDQFFEGFKELKKSPILTKEYMYKNPIKINHLSTLVRYLSNKKGLPCIYFSFSRRRCEELADNMWNYQFLNKEEEREINRLFQDLIEKFNIKGDSSIKNLSGLIRKGIAYHHAGLLPTLKEIIERLFSTGLLKFIFTTETFALGINMPARTVVFDTLSKYYERYYRYLKTRDFYQMAGRAGRRGIDKEGYVLLRINPFKIDLRNIENIIYGEYEPITSQFRSCYATILNLYKLMGEKIYDIYPRSFHYFQQNIYARKETLNLLKRKVSFLKDLRYIVDNEITWKALLASQVYSFELQIGELFEQKFFENLDITTLFVVITALVYEPRKGEKKPKLNKPLKHLKEYLDKFIKSINKLERTYRIYPLSKRFFFNLAYASQAWIEGTDFYKLHNYTDADEGEIVRTFRMAIQVLRDMSASAVVSPELKNNILNCIRIANRDVVDAEKQLRQEI